MYMPMRGTGVTRMKWAVVSLLAMATLAAAGGGMLRRSSHASPQRTGSAVAHRPIAEPAARPSRAGGNVSDEFPILNAHSIFDGPKPAIRPAIVVTAPTSRPGAGIVVRGITE